MNYILNRIYLFTGSFPVIDFLFSGTFHLGIYHMKLTPNVDIFVIETPMIIISDWAWLNTTDMLISHEISFNFDT